MLPFHVLSVFVFAMPIFVKAGMYLSNQNYHHQKLLESVDEKLNKLNYFLNVEFDPNLKKLEVIEEKLAKIESTITVQGVKINENISQSNLKYDIDKDHFLRNVDLVYDRINHKLAYLEMKIEMGEKKIFDKLEAMNLKFDKMLDNLTTREGDIEGEIVDILVAVDELKTNSESQNFTKALNKTLDHIENHINVDIIKIKESMKEQETTVSMLDKRLYSQELKLNQVARVVNETRNDMVNGLRALTVEVGRMGGKKLQTLDDEKFENTEIKNLSEKIDENFENIMLLQNLFLESCHRVQMDEAQIESKISDVLQQLIDSFEKKSSMENKDLKTLEQLIKTHDVTVRRNLHVTSQNVISLAHNAKQNKDDVNLQMLEIKKQMKLLTDEISLFKTNSSWLDYNYISDNIKKLENCINNTNMEISSNGLQTASLIQNIGNELNEIKHNIFNNFEVSNKHITSINTYLKNITNNLNEVNNFFQLQPINNTSISEIENILIKHLRKINNLNDSVMEKAEEDEHQRRQIIRDDVLTTGKSITNYLESTTEESLDDVIAKIFGKPLTNVSDDTVIKLDFPIDVRSNLPKIKPTNCTLNTCADD